MLGCPTVMKRTQGFALCAALLLAISPLAGCRRIQEKLAQKAAEKALEGTTGGKVDVDGQNITIKNADGKGTVAVGPGATVPADFPKDIPIYPGAKIMMAVQ